MRENNRQAGFTLLETILSLALTALIVGMIATMARQWLINWNRGADKIEQIEAVTLAENRLVLDLERALAFPFHPENPNPSFLGSSNDVIVVSEPTQRDGTDRLMIVRYQSNAEHGIRRSIALYDHALALDAVTFSEPVTLLPAPYQMTLSYRDREGRDHSDWHDKAMPDRMTIAISLPDGRSLHTQSIAMRTKISAYCARVQTTKDCDATMQSGKMPAAQPPKNASGKSQIQDNTGKLQP
jgi:general secretion pathway protein J